MSLTPRIDKFERNLIINGAFDYWQRGTSLNTTTGTSSYLADRFVSWTNDVTGGSIDYFRSADVPSGSVAKYSNAMTFNNTTYGSNGFAGFAQRIESGQMPFYDGSQNLTLSFWVKSEQTGNISVTFRNKASSLNPNYIKGVSIDANTWQKVKVNIPSSPFSITNPKDNSHGFSVGIVLKAENNQSEGWQQLDATLDGHNVNVDTNNNTIKITEVSLVESDFAPATFQRAGRSIGEELSLCQRYYQNLGTQGLPGSHGGSNERFECYTGIPNPMRAVPSLAGGAETASNWTVWVAPRGGVNWTPNSIDLTPDESNGVKVRLSTADHTRPDGTAGWATVSSGHLGLDAEL